MPEPGEALNDLGQHQGRSVSALDIGGVDHRINEMGLGVGEDVSLAALDLFARIVAPRTAGFRGFDALAVDHACIWGRLAPFGFACRYQQRMIDRQSQPVSRNR